MTGGVRRSKAARESTATAMPSTGDGTSPPKGCCSEDFPKGDAAKGDAAEVDTPPLVSECSALTLRLYHELRVEQRRLASGGPYFSGWFSPPAGDPHRHWRLCLDRESGGMWALSIQLASTEERDTFFRRMPRYLKDAVSWTLDLPAPEVSQTNYVLREANMSVFFNHHESDSKVQVRARRPAAYKDNFQCFGYLDTVRGYQLCSFPADWPPASTPATRSLSVKLALDVEYHTTVTGCSLPASP